ncbi:DUF4652 domain-containing protein [Thermohalobacter berrensis]|uniref:Lipoprotein n=1 Tax=Thermohalobacter berrensis TaxID=99594 RepID=A0A419T5M7_9FIRM|nr:DUF4652 domain-containing protein [Thermohalobacter berrensis]RKD32771.1 hypothetical protein BET03_10590 [Thermohalobacter berrensis]
MKRNISFCLIIIMILILSIGCTQSNSKQVNKEIDLKLQMGENVLYMKDNGPPKLVVKINGEKNIICDNFPSRPVISPDKRRMVYISPFEFETFGEVYIYDVKRGENQIIITKDNKKQNTPKSVYWLDDRYLLVISGYAYGTAHVGGDLYIYDTLNNKLRLYIEAKENKEVKDIKIHDNYITIYYAVFNDDFTDYKVKEETISKEKLYNFTKYKITLEDVKNNYNKDEIITIKEYKDKYVLVETKKKNEVNSFDFYNLETGDRDILFNNLDYMELLDIKNENQLIFLSNGLNSESGFHRFPYIVKFIRYEENIESKFDFNRIEERAYFKLSENTTFGNRTVAVISDIRITLDGIEILFKPQKGKEAEFFADYTNIPITKTSYNKEQIQFILKFDNTKVGDFVKDNKVKLNSENTYIKDIDIIQKEGMSLVLINLKMDNIEYTGEINRLNNKLPFLDLDFTVKKMH